MKLFVKHALKSAVGGEDLGSGLGFGCMGITAFYGASMPDKDAFELLKTVYDNGCRLFDTAEIYIQDGKYNESAVGEFLKTVPRDSYSIVTKYWPVPGDDVYSYETVKKSLQASLQRLHVDYVDLYLAHRVLSLEGGLRFAETAKRLKEEGLLKEIGLSEVPPNWLEEIHKICPIDVVQQEWSLMTRSLENELVPVCKKLGAAIMAYSPLARNMLAKKIEAPPTDWRATLPRYSKENLEKNQLILDQVQGLADKYGCTSAQLSLAWLFHKGHEMGVAVIPIPGSTKITNAVSNLGAVTVKISDEDSHILESLAGQVQGERYAPDMMSLTIESQK